VRPDPSGLLRQGTDHALVEAALVYTGSTRVLRADLDTFEERRVELLTEEDANISSKTR
jgi:hypothetical protein